MNAFFFNQKEHRNVQNLQFCLVMAEEKASEMSYMVTYSYTSMSLISKAAGNLLGFYDDKQKRQN